MTRAEGGNEKTHRRQQQDYREAHSRSVSYRPRRARRTLRSRSLGYAPSRLA
jgi:hypothetical protein